jgi:hypothetical protein
MPRQIASVAKVGKWKRGRPRRRWRDEIGDDLNITGIKQAGNGKRPSGVDEKGLSGRQAARQRIVALAKRERKEKKNNNIHSMMMAFVDISVVRF